MHSQIPVRLLAKRRLLLRQSARSGPGSDACQCPALPPCTLLPTPPTTQQAHRTHTGSSTAFSNNFPPASPSKRSASYLSTGAPPAFAAAATSTGQAASAVPPFTAWPSAAGPGAGRSMSMPPMSGERTASMQTAMGPEGVYYGPPAQASHQQPLYAHPTYQGRPGQVWQRPGGPHYSGGHTMASYPAPGAAHAHHASAAQAHARHGLVHPSIAPGRIPSHELGVAARVQSGGMPHDAMPGTGRGVQAVEVMGGDGAMAFSIPHSYPASHALPSQPPPHTLPAAAAPDARQVRRPAAQAAPGVARRRPKGGNPMKGQPAPHPNPGIKGVSWNKSAGKWQAYSRRLGPGKGRKHLGYYDTIEQAAEAVRSSEAAAGLSPEPPRAPRGTKRARDKVVPEAHSEGMVHVMPVAKVAAVPSYPAHSSYVAGSGGGAWPAASAPPPMHPQFSGPTHSGQSTDPVDGSGFGAPQVTSRHQTISWASSTAAMAAAGTWALAQGRSTSLPMASPLEALAAAASDLAPPAKPVPKLPGVATLTARASSQTSGGGQVA